MRGTADNRIYESDAASYDVENEGRGRTMLRKAACVAFYIEAAARGQAPRILEVGCGTGLFTRLLAESFPDARVTATDAFAPMLDVATVRLRALPNVTLEQYDAETPGSFPTSFDIVCGMDIIHHLNRPVEAMKNWLNLMAPGGWLVFFESNAWNPILRLRMLNRPEEARFKYNTRGNLTEWVKEAGWLNATAEYIPLYLPNGPRSSWPIVDRIEMVMHKLIVTRPVSGGMMVLGRAGETLTTPTSAESPRISQPTAHPIADPPRYRK